MESLRYVDLRRAGVSRRQIDRALASGALIRPWRGLYCPGDQYLSRLHALAARLPDQACFGLRTAAELHGFVNTAPSPEVHVILPAGCPRPRIQGVRAHQAILRLDEIVMIGGLRCTPVSRTAIDLARSVRRINALPILDAALRISGQPTDALIREAERHAGLPGIRQARELAAIADGRAECRQESQLRLVVLDGGLPAPEPQVTVYDDDGIAAYRLDLAYREARVGLEYDGQSHIDRRRLRADRTRMNWLASRRWTMRHFTDQDLYGHPGSIVETVRQALSRATASPAILQRWAG